MPIPTLITDLYTIAASNYPAGSDSPSTLDDVQRAHGSFIAKIRDLVGLNTGTYVPATAIANMGLTPTALGAAASGANNDITSLSVLTSINGGQLAGLRNKIINGNFGINQRAVSGTVTLAAGVYGHDRWKAGAGGCTYTFATVANVTTITITAGTLMQVIEGINLESGAFTLSWTGSATGRVDSGAYGASGIAGTAVGGTNQKVEFSTGTLSKVQYEFGSTISKFETRLSSIELMLCYAYYLRLVIATAGTFQNVGEAGGCFVATKVTMRATPTVLDIGGGTLANVTIAAADTPSPQGCRFVVTGTALGAWNALGRTIQFTAEL